MKQIDIGFMRGLFTGGDRLRLPEGALAYLRGWYYRLGDPARVWKIPGRVQAGEIGSADDIRGLKHIQYEDETDILVVHGNQRLYESPAALSDLSFTTAKDANGDDFTPNGAYLRVAHDGMNQWWHVVGENDRPLVRDYDGNWRRAGLIAPEDIPAIEGVTATPTHIKPSGAAAGPNGGFHYPERAYDDDAETAAAGSCGPRIPPECGYTDWTFDPGTDVTGMYLSIDIEGEMRSREPPEKAQRMNPELGGVSLSWVKLEYSEDGGSSWTTIYEGMLTVRRTFQQELSDGVDSGDLIVRVHFGGSPDGLTHLPVTTRVYEIWASTGSVSDEHIPAGTYQYVVSEVYRRTLSDGRVVEVESPPTKARTVSVPANTYYGIKITLPARANMEEDGYTPDVLFRRIYRTTSTGSWPDMGMVGECAITASTYLDDFASVPYDSLGQPPLPVVNVGDSWYNACGAPMGLLDVCLYRGALVGISAADNRRLYWSLPGYPENWPIEIHTMRLLPTERQDRLKAIISLGDVMLLFSRNQVFRIRGLPFASRPSFDLSQTEIAILSPAIGLAGRPPAVCLAHAFDGYPLVFWVSDNGIWMTDGGLPSEGGVGVMKVSLSLDWDSDVDTSRLEETALGYDVANQLLRFQYFDPDGNRREIWFHVAPEHWVQLIDGVKAVPKASGPHSVGANAGHLVDLAAGEHGGIFRVWSLDSRGRVYTEMTGTADEGEFSGQGREIVSVLETGWFYPSGPLLRTQILRAACYHTDWGHQVMVLEIRGRDDDSGTLQHLVERSVPLVGERVSLLDTARAAGGQALMFRLEHVGRASGGIGGLGVLTEDAGFVES